MKTRIRIRRRVLTWFVSRWRNHQFKQAEKPHSKFSARKTLDGPATRPETPLAVENSVGKLAAAEMWRQMPARERELGELPSPIWSLLDRKVGQGLDVLTFPFPDLRLREAFASSKCPDYPLVEAS